MPNRPSCHPIRVRRSVAAVLAAALATGACTSFDYELLRKHVLPTDENGRIVDVESGRALADDDVDALIRDLLQEAQAGATAQARTSGRRELLIHIHGGLNPATASLATAQAALRRMQDDPHAPHAIFIIWPSGAFSTWSDHLLRVRQGVRWPQAPGWATAPFILVSDLASSIAAAPRTLLFQWALDARVAAKVAF
ncbi:MAG TPA: hypothetical protein VK081_03915, partial [Planctomycetota bacterium]|nr:hypothetical protein [Planctomycetota bacterium]